MFNTNILLTIKLLVWDYLVFNNTQNEKPISKSLMKQLKLCAPRGKRGSDRYFDQTEITKRAKIAISTDLPLDFMSNSEFCSVR